MEKPPARKPGVFLRQSLLAFLTPARESSGMMSVADRLKSSVKAALPGRYHLGLDAAWSRLTWPLYVGNRVECPLCGGRFRKFLKLHERASVRCPRCRSFDRHRLLWLYLQARTDLMAGRRRLLHMAPEGAIQQRLGAVPGLQYVSVDIAMPIVDVKADITRLPFRDGAFDCLMCYHVLEHVADDRAAMAELARILAPGGWGLVQVPQSGKPETDEDPAVTDPAERHRRFGQYDHVRYYGDDFKGRLEEAGFRVIVEEYAKELCEDTIRRMGLPREEKIFRVER